MNLRIVSDTQGLLYVPDDSNPGAMIWILNKYSSINSFPNDIWIMLQHGVISCAKAYCILSKKSKHRHSENLLILLGKS